MTTDNIETLTQGFNFHDLGRKRYQYIFSITNGVTENVIGTCWGVSDAQKFYMSLARELRGSVKVTVYRGVNQQVGEDIPLMFKEVMKK